MKLVFDTNVFRDIQDGTITQSEVQLALNKLVHGDVGCLSAITLVELGSHIDRKEKRNFPAYRDSFLAATKLCSVGLPDPERFMMEHSFGIKPWNGGISGDFTMLMAKLIATARDYGDVSLLRPMSELPQGMGAAFNTQFLRKFRDDYELKYIKDMYEKVATSIIPNFANLRAASQTSKKPVRLKAGPERTAFLNFVDGLEVREAFLKAQAAKLNVNWSNMPWLPEEVGYRLNAFCGAYFKILKEFVRDGYNIERNKNDFNDMHFLVYLSDPEVILVSQDKKASRKVPDDSPQKSRIVSFTDWIRSP